MKPIRIRNDVTVRDILLYNPHDIETNLKGKGFSEEHFEHFFYLIPEFKSYGERIKNYIEPGENHRNFVILSGYSGSGKTTLLHWLKKSYLPNDIYFNITNLSELPVVDSEINVLEKTIVLKLKKLLKTPVLNDLVFKNLEKLKEYTSDNSILDDVYEIYLRSHNKAPYSDKELNSFLSKYNNKNNFRDLLFLYILEHIGRINISEYKSLVFCFDNLDDVKFEYLTESFWNDFIQVRSDLIRFFNDDPLDIEFDFQSKFSFMLVFREANLIIRSSDYLDRMFGVLVTEKIILSESARKIISKRLKILNTYYRIVLEKSSISYLVQIISESQYSDHFYLPLFNYDYRKLMQAMVEIGTCQSENKSPIMPENRYRAVSKISKRLARGAIIHRLIKYLFKNDYLLNFASIPDTPNLLPEKGFCRKSRILLTIIYRFSYPNGIPDDNFKRKLITPKKVLLYDIYKSFSELFPNDVETFDLIEQFFDIFKSSWAHLISIYNMSGDRVKINFEKEKSLLRDVTLGNRDIADLESVLRKYKIHINSSGYIYLRNILIHFEYFTNLINERNNTNYKSLIESVDYDPIKHLFEFQVIINKVYKKLANYKTNIDNFIEHQIEKEGHNLEWYLNEEYVFRQSPSSNPNLYFTRVVSSHIDYLDKFRYLIFNDNELKRKMITNKVEKSKINEFLVNKIEDYLFLLHKGYQDNASITFYKEKNKRIKKVKIKGYEEWVPIV